MSSRSSKRSGRSPGVKGSSIHKSERRQSDGSFDESDSVSSREERDLTIDDMLTSSVSPGIKAARGFDVPLLRDKTNNYECLETVISAIINGCVFGKLVQTQSKESGTWLYSTVALTDCFLLSLGKNEISYMVET